MRKDISLHATLNDCERLTGVEDLLRFGDWLAQRGFRMLVYPQPSQEVTLSGADIASYFAQTGPNGVHDWLQKRRDKYPFSYGRPLLAPGMEELLWHFGVEYDSRVNRMAVGLGGLVDFEFRDQRAWAEPYAQRLDELVRSLAPEIQPALVSVDELSSCHWLKDVLKRQLKHINWVNIFGSPYVAKYGRAFLLGLPGYRTEEWADGSIYYQLSPTFVLDDLKAARALRKQVVDYCAQAGLKVTCRAPYQLPRAQPTRQAPAQQPEEAEEPIPDISVQIYMQEILGTTLLLDDGTRVKPVAVPWEALTPVQVEIALTAIKAVAIDEIRQHQDQRIRFEFNELPEALDALMADLVGRDNPDFEYVQVDMGM